MADILFYPPLPTRPQLYDQLFRALWHFLPTGPRLTRLLFPYAGGDFALLDAEQILVNAKAYMSRDLDPEIAAQAPRYSGKVALLQIASRDPDSYAGLSKNLQGVIVWSCDPQTVAAAHIIAEKTGAEVVLADPLVVQQETLLTMRFVYKLFTREELGVALVNECYARFLSYLKTWKGKSVAVFGNGPSLAKVVEAGIDPGAELRVVCNSTIGDDAALAHLKPEILACGDPVQHWGASLYAGRFRADVQRALAGDPARVLITQLGYVPYFREVLPAEFHARIIGVGNNRQSTFNIDLGAEFLTTATSNILTMLMLPLGFTISNRVDVFGCDGMAFKAATKPWSHANESDYMGKMAVTRRVHPGFWKRNYEEEYWSYCQDLEDIIQVAEAKGIAVQSRTPSFVPALAKRYVPIP